MLSSPIFINFDALHYILVRIDCESLLVCNRLSAEGSNLQLTIDGLQSNVDELTRARDELVTTLSSQRTDAEREINDLKVCY